MSAPRIAARYAEAAFELARERDSVAAVGRELDELTDLLEESDELRGLLARADVPRDRKIAALRTSLGQAFSDTLVSVLAVLVNHGRGDAVPQVAHAYGELADQAAGVVRAEVCTVVTLSEEQRERLIAALKRMTGKHIRLAEQTDARILAGVRLQVGDRLIDGSAAGRLARLREELIKLRG